MYKKDTKFDQKYWESRWRDGATGWDIGYVSPPLKEIIDDLTDQKLHILIPGCGNAYEAEYLWEKGFENTHVIDLSISAIKTFKKRLKQNYDQNIFHGDFFDHEGKYDLILEQTFFCALNPSLRKDYVLKMKDLLKEGGRVAGLLFNFPLDDGPPFGGSKELYEDLFSPHFIIDQLEECKNSIPPRSGRELKFNFIRK